jgi:hypothetical protein
MPELVRNAIAEKKSPQLDAVTSAFAMAGEKQQEESEQDTKAGFRQLPGSPDIERARLQFEHAQKVEEGFHKDFDGLDYGKR